MVDKIVEEAEAHPFGSSPKEIKHKLDLDVSRSDSATSIAWMKMDYMDASLQISTITLTSS